MDGNIFAILGATIAAGFTGICSAMGVSWVQRASCGVITEYPERYNKTLMLQLIPSSNALYGFVVAFLILAKIVIGTGVYSMTNGIMLCISSLTVGIAGGIAGLLQAKVCTACVIMIGKREELSGRSLTMAVMTELFALFAFIISILCVLLIPTVA